jgi:hypothetical protein
MRRTIFIFFIGFALPASALPDITPLLEAIHRTPEQCAQDLAALKHKGDVATIRPLVAGISSTDELVAALFRARTLDGFTQAQTDALLEAVSRANRWRWFPFLETPLARVASQSLPRVQKLIEFDGVPIDGPSRKLARFYTPDDPRLAPPPEATASPLVNYLAKKDWAGQMAAFEIMDQWDKKERPLWYEELMYDLSKQLKYFRSPSTTTKQRPDDSKLVANHAMQILRTVPFTGRGEEKPPLEPLTKAQHDALVALVRRQWEKGMTQDEIATAFYLARQSELNPILQNVAQDAAEAVKVLEAAKGKADDSIKLHSPSDIGKYLRLRGEPEVVAFANELASTANGFIQRGASFTPTVQAEPAKLTAQSTSDGLLTKAKEHALLAPKTPVAPLLEPSSSEVAGHYRKYAHELNDGVLELDFATPILRRTLLAETNVLMISGPGAAKSMLARYTLSRILDANGKPSFFEKQLNSQTTVSDIVGIPDPKAMAEGRIKRFASRGILGYGFAFLDEVLNAGPRILTMLNEIMNERRFSESGRVFKAKTRVVFGATNKTLPQFRHEAKETDDPEAILARYSAKFLVPDEVRHHANAVRLLEGNLPGGPNPIQSTDMDHLRTLIPKVQISKQTSLATSALYFDMKRSLEHAEQVSREQVARNIRKNPDAVAFQRTHEYSNRGLANWGKILRAGVVDDWAVSGGNRDLTIELKDLPDNKFAILMEGPSTAFLQRKANTAPNPFEKAQYQDAITEREIFQTRWNKLTSAIQSSLDGTRAKIEQWKQEGSETDKGKELLAELVAVSERGAEIEKEYLEVPPDDPNAQTSPEPKHASFDEVASYYAALEVRSAFETAFAQRSSSEAE